MSLEKVDTIANYVHQDDLVIERDHPQHGGRTVVMDCDGYFLFTVAKDIPDEEVFHIANSVMNKFYNKGYESGQRKRARDIRDLLQQLGVIPSVEGV